mmetsp:Transcript_62443/g.184730  ORF Transcript_62443/g.184730 Transcript_62443/m.184730 type:complete len:246 (+) Transcript_62443:302-1039(+)
MHDPERGGGRRRGSSARRNVRRRRARGERRTTAGPARPERRTQSRRETTAEERAAVGVRPKRLPPRPPRRCANPRASLGRPSENSERTRGGGRGRRDGIRPNSDFSPRGKNWRRKRRRERERRGTTTGAMTTARAISRRSAPARATRRTERSRCSPASTTSSHRTNPAAPPKNPNRPACRRWRLSPPRSNPATSRSTARWWAPARGARRPCWPAPPWSGGTGRSSWTHSSSFPTGSPISVRSCPA